MIERLPADVAGQAPAAPVWFVRINPLRRCRLADPALRSALDELALAEDRTSTAAKECSEVLFALIGAASDDDERRRLVALRRAVHKDRAPRSEDVAAVAGLRRWSQAREERDARRRAFVEGYPGHAARERAGLADLLGQDDLRRALALISPQVHDEAERYRASVELAQPRGAVAAKVRKSERGLVQYVTRAMVRTSPLSRFTAIGLLVPTAGAPAPDLVDCAGATAFPSLDRVMLDFVLGGLDPAPDIDAHWVALPPTSAVDLEAGKLCFLRPVPDGLARVAVPLSPPVQSLLDAVAMGPRPARAVAAHLAAATGVAFAHARGTVRSAVRGGLLCSSPDAEDGSASLLSLLTRPGSPAEPRLAAVRDGLRLLVDGPTAERPVRLGMIRDDLAATSRLAGRPAMVPVAEDYVLPPAPVDPTAWRGPLDDLGAATELLSLFDWLHDVRVLMSAAFVDRFGAGASVNLAEHARFLVAEVSRRAVAVEAVHREGGGSLAGIGPADGCLDRLQALRRRVTAEMHDLLTASVTAGSTETHLTPDDARALTAGLDDRFRADPLLYGVLVQPAGHRLILNDGLPGHGMLFSRFLDADRALGGDAIARLGDRLRHHYGRDGHRVVEDAGLHGLNVNAHPTVLPDILRPDDWFDLRLEHDRDTDALRVTDTEGRHLRVLPLGAGHPGLFPPPLSVATGLVISGRLYSGLVTTWQAASGWDGCATQSCPRVTVGDVVLARRRWYGGTEMADAVAAGPDDHAPLLALNSWRHSHGVPEEVVLKTTPADEGPLSVGAPDVQASRLQQKPQYVDLASALSVRVLPRMLERRTGPAAGLGYIEEALPGVEAGPHAVEWVVEVGRAPHGRFEHPRLEPTTDRHEDGATS